MVELRELANDIAQNMVTGFPGPRLRDAVDAVTGADGLIAVTPVFTGSYSGLFKSFFDVIDKDALAGRPVLVAATGGTARHSLVLDHAMRPLFAYLRAVVVPTARLRGLRGLGCGRRRRARRPYRPGRGRTRRPGGRPHRVRDAAVRPWNVAALSAEGDGRVAMTRA